MEIGVHGACVADDRLWFSLKKGNGLCSMDLDTGDAFYVTSIPGEDIFGTALYEDIKQCGCQLILIPGNAKEIAVYDMNTKEITKVPVQTEHLKYGDGYDGFGKFQSALVMDEWIYFVPRRFPAIVKMNARTFEMFYLEDWIRDIFPYYRADRLFFRKDIVNDGNGMIYLTSLYYNMILSIDTRSDQTLIVRKGDVGDGCGCSCISHQNNMFLLSERNQQKLSFFDRHWNLKHQINLPGRLSDKYLVDYIQSVVWRNYIFYIPFGAATMLRLDMDTNNMEIVRQWEQDHIPVYEGAWLHKENIYCYKDCHIEIFNMKGCLIGSISIHGQKDFENAIMSELFMHENILEETQMIQTADFLQFLNKRKIRIDKNAYVSCGDKIYAKIMELK